MEGEWDAAQTSLVSRAAKWFCDFGSWLYFTLHTVVLIKQFASSFSSLFGSFKCFQEEAYEADGGDSGAFPPTLRYEVAYADPAQVGARCQVATNEVAGNDVRQTFSVQFGPWMLRQALMQDGNTHKLRMIVIGYTRCREDRYSNLL